MQEAEDPGRIRTDLLERLKALDLEHGSGSGTLAELAYRRAREALEKALEEARTLRLQAIDDARRTREQEMSSLQQSLLAHRQAAEAEIEALLEREAVHTPGLTYELRDLMVVHPVRTPASSPVIGALERAIERVLGRPAEHIASPGTYDHKHVDRIAGIPHCVAYGPGILDLAHQPDEWCGIDDLINATKVLALAVLDLTTPPA